jgi:hypothetical protein
VEGVTDPVVQVISELGGEIVYTIRMAGSSFTPPVFEPGSYRVTVGEPGTDAIKTLLGLQATADPNRRVVVRFGADQG